jgi:type I restriction enzyme, S subunit
MMPRLSEVPLHEICDTFQYGLTARASREAKDFKFLRITDIQNGTIEWPSVPGALIKNGDIRKFTLRDGDFVFARSGATVGKALRVDDPPESVFASYLIRFRPKDDEISEWLKWFLRSPQYWKQVRAAASGIGMPNISASKLSEFRVPLAPKQHRERIIRNLALATDNIEKAKADLIRADRLVNHYRNQLVSSVDISAFPLMKLSDLAETIFDGPFGSNLKSSDYEPSGTLVVRLENIGHLRFNREKRAFVSASKADSLRRHSLKPDDVLFSSFVDKEIRVCLFPSDLKAPAISKADCFCFRPNPNLCTAGYVALQLASRSTYDKLIEAVHGATRPRVSLRTLKSFEIHVPPLLIQERIVAEVGESLQRATAVASQCSRALKLLEKLNGEILSSAFG